ITRKCPVNRAHTISSSGYSVLKSFAQVLRKGNMLTPRHIRRMPRKASGVRWGVLSEGMSGDEIRAEEQARSGELYEVLQAAQLARGIDGRIDLGPGRVGDLADVEVAVAVDREPVRRNELPHRLARMHTPEPSEKLPFAREDADARAKVRRVAVDRIAGT